MSGYWYFTFPIILMVILNLKFYFYTHREEFKKYDEWRNEFSKTHTYLGITPFYETEIWENKLTGEQIEI